MWAPILGSPQPGSVRWVYTCSTAEQLYVCLYSKVPAGDVHGLHAPARPAARRHTMVRLEIRFVTGPSCAASLWAALGRAVGAHRSVSTVSGRPRAACRAWHVELAERQAALASLLSQRPSHPTDRPASARPPPAFLPLQAVVGGRNGSCSMPRGCSAPRCRSCWHWTGASCCTTYRPAHCISNCSCCANL